MWMMVLKIIKSKTMIFWRVFDDVVRALAWVWLLFCFASVVSLKAVVVKHNQTLQRLTELRQSVASERELAAKTAAQMRDQASLDGERKAADLTRQNANLTVANAILKKDIAHAYANFGHTKLASAPVDPHGSAVGNGDTDVCFGTEFGRLWNRANANSGSETTAPECGADGAPCAGAAAD